MLVDMLDPRFAHDPMTLSRRGIFASWKKFSNADSQMQSYADDHGEWIEGMGSKAGEHLAFTIDAVAANTGVALGGKYGIGIGTVLAVKRLVEAVTLPPSTCQLMANDAQRFADQTQARFPNATSSFRRRHFNRLFGQLTFGASLEEGPGGMVGIATSYHFSPAETKTTEGGIGRKYHGQAGFDPRFYDKDSISKDGNVDLSFDQVHHFGAYFSAALTGHKAAPWAHRFTDSDTHNWGDVYLADQATALGWYIRLNPNQLSNIGSLIQSTICGGRAVPGTERK